MSRDISAGMQAEVVKPVLQERLFFEGLFDSGALRLWNDISPITWNGVEWTGAGNLIGVSEVTESQELKAIGVSVRLSGIPSSIISIALAEDYQGRKCNIWLGLMNESGQIITDPYLLFGGRADVMQIEDGGTAASVTLTAESRLIDLERSRQRRYEHEDQIALYPGDLFYQYGPSFQDSVINWGHG